MSYIKDLTKVYNSERVFGGIVYGAIPLTESELSNIYDKYSIVFKQLKSFYQNSVDSKDLVNRIVLSLNTKYSFTDIYRVLFIVRVLGGGSPDYSKLIQTKYKLPNYSAQWMKPSSQVNLLIVAAIASLFYFITK